MEATITKTNPLGTERVGKLMMRYAVPSIISIVVNSLYNMVDQVFIGQGVGYLGNAATNVIMPISTIMLALGFMFGDGAAAFMSLHLGKKEPEKAAKGIGNMVAIVIGTGIVLMILFELFLTPLCRLFGATDNVLPYALDYGRIIVLGFPFSIICSAFGSPIRADGRPKISMVGLLIGCATNMILDPIFIFVCGWGVKGAAWATILGQVLNALYFIICLSQFKTIKIKKEYFIPDVKVVGNIASLGTSSLISQIASVFVIAIMNNMLVKYGAVSKYGADIPLAALGVTMKVSQLITGVTLGIASGVQPILGYNYGSRQHDRVKSTLKRSLILGTAIMFVALFIFQVFPEQIIGIFGQESDLYVEFAVKCFRIYLLACFLIPSGAVVGIFFQAIGKPVPAAALTLSRQIILLIPAMLILGYTMGVEGILWAGPFSDALSGIIALITVKVFWKRIFENKGQKETAGRKWIMSGQVITIGRQCGSGGHTIGEQVAKILGVPFYDRELIEMTAQESGFGKEFVEEQGEHRNSSMLYNLVKNLSYSRTMPSGNSEYLQDEIFFAQRKIITALAEKEPCVIVGRCADSILKETGNSLNIYIHAEKAFKAKHLMERKRVSYDEAVREMERLDKRRASHYKYYTDQIWGLAENYHLCLDSSLIGIEKCVSVICDIYQSINVGQYRKEEVGSGRDPELAWWRQEQLRRDCQEG